MTIALVIKILLVWAGLSLGSVAVWVIAQAAVEDEQGGSFDEHVTQALQVAANQPERVSDADFARVLGVPLRVVR